MLYTGTYSLVVSLFSTRRKLNARERKSRKTLLQVGSLDVLPVSICSDLFLVRRSRATSTAGLLLGRRAVGLCDRVLSSSSTSRPESIIDESDSSEGKSEGEDANVDTESSSVLWFVVGSEDLGTVDTRRVGSHDHPKAQSVMFVKMTVGILTWPWREHALPSLERSGTSKQC